jgi:hypothetical protein
MHVKIIESTNLIEHPYKIIKYLASIVYFNYLFIYINNKIYKNQYDHN